jgi:hypothetical protein
MGKECFVKGPLRASGYQTVEGSDGKRKILGFTAQLQEPQNPTGPCIIVTLLNLPGDKKKTGRVKISKFSDCAQCGRSVHLTPYKPVNPV